MTVEQAVDLLRHCNVTLKPVIDLNEPPSADCYQPGPRVREIVELRSRVDVFPSATLSSRKADKDHTVPYRPPDDGGPPGQTAPDNLGPVSRLHHRLKTHGWECSQPQREVYVWRSPHGLWARVDGFGTHYLGKLVGLKSVAEQDFLLLLPA